MGQKGGESRKRLVMGELGVDAQGKTIPKGGKGARKPKIDYLQKHEPDREGLAGGKESEGN